ncbi:MAG: hypothetical protein RLZZ76_57 [Candidatus Parcubacteria bacterium]|jgi:hypothetical protein
MKLLRWILLTVLILAITLAVILYILARKEVPEKIQYGMSFNTMYANELGLDWKETYDAIIDELGVRHLRLAAHWPMVEPIDDIYNFEELDYQVARAEEVGAEVVFAVGRRLPRWPECHVPLWAAKLTQEERQEQVLDYVTVVINRYKDSEAIKYWQIENEPYLEVFAKDHCGEFDEAFFEREVAHFRSLDDSRPFLITDSGNLGTWIGPYKHGDAFGTSVYIHFWNPELGQFRTIIPPWFYRVKESLLALFYGEKETMLIELSAEPWLLEPITNVDIETQYSRMDLEKFNDILEYAKDTRYEKQYLWGAEWWYWLQDKGHPEMWERGKELFKNE